MPDLQHKIFDCSKKIRGLESLQDAAIDLHSQVCHNEAADAIGVELKKYHHSQSLATLSQDEVLKLNQNIEELPEAIETVSCSMAKVLKAYEYRQDFNDQVLSLGTAYPDKIRPVGKAFELPMGLANCPCETCQLVFVADDTLSGIHDDASAANWKDKPSIGNFNSPLNCAEADAFVEYGKWFDDDGHITS